MVEQIPCPDCAGTGWVYVGDGEQDQCPTCQGTGSVESDEPDTDTRWFE